MHEKILVVDDNDLIRDVLRYVLTAEYDVSLAGSYDEAWQLIQGTPPDLILTDLRLSSNDYDSSGIGLYWRVKSRKMSPDIKFLFMSASGEAELKKIIMDNPEIDELKKLIPKPFSIDLLKDRMQEVLRAQSSNQQ